MGLGFLPRWSNCAGTAVNSLLPGKVTTVFALLVRITNSSKQSIIRVIGIKLTGGDSPGQDSQPTARFPAARTVPTRVGVSNMTFSAGIIKKLMQYHNRKYAIRQLNPNRQGAIMNI